jgi:predicted Zn-ribbon and HTH transcriptional regulator
MGELTEAIINGEQCERCGSAFDEACGYPRTCEVCKQEDIRAKGREIRKERGTR